MAGNGIGVVAELGTAVQLATAIADFFSDSERLQQWRGRLEVVREELSWQCEGERLKGIYEELR